MAASERWTRPTGYGQGGGQQGQEQQLELGLVETPAPVVPATSEDVDRAAAEQESQAKKDARAARRAEREEAAAADAEDPPAKRK